MKKGLGDTIASITKATGVDKLVHKVVGEDCGCDKRRDKLNQLFPYYNELTAMDKKNIEEHLIPEHRKGRITAKTKTMMYEIYDRTFNRSATRTNCPSCVKEQMQKLIYLYEQSCTSEASEPK